MVRVGTRSTGCSRALRLIHVLPARCCWIGFNSKSLLGPYGEVWVVIAPYASRNQPGARRVDDTQVISGIVDVLRDGATSRLSAGSTPPSTMRGIAGAAAVSGAASLTRRLPQAASMRSANSTAATSKLAARLAAQPGGRDTGHRDQPRRAHHQDFAVCELLGRPIGSTLRPANTSDIKAAPALIGAAGRLKRLMADRGYDASSLRRDFKAVARRPIILGRRNRKRPI